MNNPVVAFGGDEIFVQKLSNYFTLDDVARICESYSKPITNVNINPRTGRTRIGIPKTRPRKLLCKDTLRNYKSIITRFGEFKRDNFGTDGPITRDIIEKYYTEKILDGRRMHHTMITVTNVLNKYIVVPITGEELPKPTAIKSLTGNFFSNKPKFKHSEMALATLRMYKTCKNRDHVHKILLIYYTGLRSHEASSLTFNDIVNGYSKTAVVIPVRKGKGRQFRNVVIFRGGPMTYYREYFLPYIISKLEKLLSTTNENQDVEELLNVKIFSNSKYHACIKTFRKRLHYAVTKIKELDIDNGNEKDDDDDGDEEEEEDEEEEDVNESIKGCGLHSLRTDWATRINKLLFSINKHPTIAINVTSRLLGHRSDGKVINKHYISVGDDFDNQNHLDEIKDLLKKEHIETIIPEDYDINNFAFQNEKIAVLFKGRGKIIKGLLKSKNSKKIYNICNLFKVYDDNYILPSKRNAIFNGLTNNDDDDDDNNIIEPTSTPETMDVVEDNIDNNTEEDANLVGNLMVI